MQKTDDIEFENPSSGLTTYKCSGDGGDEISGGVGPVCVGVGEAGALYGLGGLGQRHGLPVRDFDECAIELGGGVDGVHDLRGGAPALRWALLEQAEAVAVAVVQVVEAGFLQRGGDGYLRRVLRQARGDGDLVDGGGIGQLFAAEGAVAGGFAGLDLPQDAVLGGVELLRADGG